jgi:hypothetical protein
MQERAAAYTQAKLLLRESCTTKDIPNYLHNKTQLHKPTHALASQLSCKARVCTCLRSQMCRCSQVRKETSRLLTHTRAFEAHGLAPGLPVTPCPAAWCVPLSVRLQGALSCEAAPAGGPGWQPPALRSPA